MALLDGKGKRRIDMLAGIVAATLMIEASAMNLPVTPVYNIDTEISEEYVQTAIDIGTEYDIAPELIIAIIEHESEGNPDVVSGCGAIGLMQVIPKFQEERCERLGVVDLSNGHENILVGTDYLQELFEKYEDIQLVLTAYRFGEYSEQFQKAQNTGYLYSYVREVINRSDELQEIEYGY